MVITCDLAPLPLERDTIRDELLTIVFQQHAANPQTFISKHLIVYIQHKTNQWSTTLNALESGNNETYTILQKANVNLVASIIRGLENAQPLETQFQDVRNFLHDDHLDPKALEMAVHTVLELSIRLWLMCEIAIQPNCQIIWQSSSTYALWDNTTHSLRHRMREIFSQSTTDDETNLGRSFRLYHIQKMANIEVMWTSNLLDHLRVEHPKDHGKPYMVYIFHHRRFLKYHSDRKSTTYPTDLIEETLRTLDLLLPRDDRDTRKWYKKVTKKYSLDDSACMGARPLSHHDHFIKSYVYWRDRLIILKEVFDEMEPSTILHFWFDKRRPVQWATFWVAILVFCLTVFFGLVQSIEGALQVYKAYHPTPN